MKTIVITGASKGIGFETALSLLNQGCYVVAIARSSGELEQLRSQSSSKNLLLITADITSKEELEKISSEVAKLEKIDGLINNAGMVLNRSFLETSQEDWRSIFDVNFLHLFSLSEY